MKKKLCVFCALILMQALICNAMSFADEMNETYEESISVEIEEETVVDVEEITEEKIENETVEETLIDGKEMTEEEIKEEILVDDETTEEEILSEVEEEIVEEVVAETEENVSPETNEIIEDNTIEAMEEPEEDVVISTESECSDVEETDDVYVEYEEENIEDIKEIVATPSIISVKLNWLSNVYMDDIGMGGSYDTKWKTFYIESGDEVEIPEEIALVLNYENCNQEYNLIGFTTNNQEEMYWLYADYAGGEKMYDTSFIVEENIELWAVYEAKYKYVSSVVFDDDGISYKETSIPNLAIKHIIKMDNESSKVGEDYKMIEYGDMCIAYTKNNEKGSPLDRAEMDGFLSRYHSVTPAWKMG